MRHNFSFPPHIRHALKKFIDQCIRDIDPRRYKQEPAYTAALARSLEGKSAGRGGVSHE